MGQTTDQIAAHIEHTRDHLGANLNELEHRVKSATDWHQHFQANPLTMLGVAFGGGVMLAAMLGGRRGRRGPGISGRNNGTEVHVLSDQQRQQALETWDHIKGALIGVAATRFTEFVGDIVPGFTDQFQRAEAQGSATRWPRPHQETL